jgi:hypothetical protein
MSPRKSVLGAMLFLLMLVGAVAISQLARRGSEADSAKQIRAAARVEVVRVEPPADAISEMECASLAFVELAYRAFNRGEAPITGLKLGTKCACEAIGDPPGEILPGESATISFRLRGPYAGRMQRKIPILVDGETDPVAILDVWLWVKFEPPRLIPPPNGLTITFIKGEASPPELALQAMEEKGVKPWIRAIDLFPADAIEVLPLRMDELLQPDPALTLRSYHFRLVDRSLPVGRQMMAATVRTTDGFPPVHDALSVWVDVVDAVALVPNPLVIKYAPGSSQPGRRMRVLHRLGTEERATPIEYNHELLRIEETDSAVVFNIAPIQTPSDIVETQVVFNVGDDQTRSLVVRLEPLEQR